MKVEGLAQSQLLIFVIFTDMLGTPSDTKASTPSKPQSTVDDSPISQSGRTIPETPNADSPFSSPYPSGIPKHLRNVATIGNEANVPFRKLEFSFKSRETIARGVGLEQFPNPMNVTKRTPSQKREGALTPSPPELGEVGPYKDNPQEDHNEGIRANVMDVRFKIGLTRHALLWQMEDDEIAEFAEEIEALKEKGEDVRVLESMLDVMKTFKSFKGAWNRFGEEVTGGGLDVKWGYLVDREYKREL